MLSVWLCPTTASMFVWLDPAVAPLGQSYMLIRLLFALPTMDSSWCTDAGHRTCKLPCQLTGCVYLYKPLPIENKSYSVRAGRSNRSSKTTSCNCTCKKKNNLEQNMTAAYAADCVMLTADLRCNLLMPCPLLSGVSTLNV